MGDIKNPSPVVSSISPQRYDKNKTSTLKNKRAGGLQITAVKTNLNDTQQSSMLGGDSSSRRRQKEQQNRRSTIKVETTEQEESPEKIALKLMKRKEDFLTMLKVAEQADNNEDFMFYLAQFLEIKDHLLLIYENNKKIKKEYRDIDLTSEEHNVIGVGLRNNLGKL